LGGRRDPRCDVEPDDLPAGDGGLGRLRRAVRLLDDGTAFVGRTEQDLRAAITVQSADLA
jgi:hypothetical protein